jgi:hypothetical protein
VALDLEPDEVYSRALNVVQRAERKLWPLRLKVRMSAARSSARPDRPQRRERRR